MARSLVRAAIGLMLGCALWPASGPARAAPDLRVGAAPALMPALTLGITPVANWRNPYGNIDPRWDAGNDTGDAMVDRLNQQQLNRIERGGFVRPRRYRQPLGYYGPYRYGPPHY